MPMLSHVLCPFMKFAMPMCPCHMLVSMIQSFGGCVASDPLSGCSFTKLEVAHVLVDHNR